MKFLARLKFLLTGDLTPIAAVQRLEVKAGDTVVLQCESNLYSDEAAARIKELAERALPPGTKIIVLPPQIRVGALIRRFAD